MSKQLESVNDVYVMVIHLSTGRAFTLDRGYQIISSLIEQAIKKPDSMILDRWKGWLPTMEYQRPSWIENIPEEEFMAFWF